MICRDQPGDVPQQLGNVLRACEIMEYSHNSFYRLKGLYEQGGEVALQEISCRKPVIKSRAEKHIEQAVIQMAKFLSKGLPGQESINCKKGNYATE